MQVKSNDLHVRVTYATDCPEWWRIQVRRRLGKQGLATREECIDWLRRYGESEDDNLALAFEAWNKAAADKGREGRMGVTQPMEPHTLALTWVLDDPGVVHLRPRAYDYALCGKRALSTVEVIRRAVTCDRCKEVADGR